MARKKQSDAGKTDNIWTHFNLEDPAPDRQGEDRGSKAAQDNSMDAVLERMNRLEADLNTARQTNYALMAQGQHQQGQGGYQLDPSKLKLDLSGMPDPYSDADKYNAELTKRTNAVIEAREYALRQEIRSETEQTRSKEQLWNGFSAKYPQWTEFPEVVGTVAERLVKQAQARGLDPQRYMFVGQTQFYDDIAKELNTTYGALIKDEEDPTQRDTEPKQAQRSSTQRSNVDQGTISGGFIPHGAALEPDDDGRTAILGGQESGGKSTGTRQADPRPGMIEDLSEWQRKSGYF